VTPTIKFLIGSACAALIAAAAYLSLSEHQENQRQAQARQAVADSVDARRKKKNLDECREVVTAWDDGSKGPAIKKYGTGAKEGIYFCRALIDLSKPRNP